MRVNGINSYANVQAFRGTEAATGEEKAEKSLTKKQLQESQRAQLVLQQSAYHF